MIGTGCARNSGRMRIFVPSPGRIRDGSSTLCPGVTGELMFIARTPGQSVLAPPRIFPARRSSNIHRCSTRRTFRGFGGDLQAGRHFRRQDASLDV